MSDDLVKRLREDQPVTQDMVSTMQCALQDEAAARIEALEQQVADLLADVPCACGYDNPTDVCMKHLPLVRNLTAKLAKAVEALRAVDALDPEGMIDGCSHSALRGLVLRMGHIARATLADIEGEKG
jgi:hypothetical protein